MDLHYLEYIATLAKVQNMSKAADELHISQPALSIYVKNLEEELGIPLFSRSRGKIEPTEAGKAYADACNRILEIRDALFITLEGMRTAQLRIAITTSNTSAVLRSLNKFHRIHPNVNLIPNIVPATEIDQAIQNKTIDFAVSSGSLDPRARQNVAIQELFLQQYELMLVLSSDNPVYQQLGPEHRLTMENVYLLKPLPFISQLSGRSKTKYDLQILLSLGITPQKLIPLNDLSFMIQSILRDNSYALMPYSHFMDGRIQIFPLPVSVKHFATRVLKFSSDRKLNEYDKSFIQTIQNHYQNEHFFYYI